MKPVEFKGFTHDFRKPETMNEKQCESLPALVHTIDIEGEKFNAIESVWQLDDEEVKQLLESRLIRLRVIANGMPPVNLFVEPIENIGVAIEELNNVISLNPNIKLWPESTSVARTTLIPEESILEVEFRNGKVYHFKKFPAILFPDVVAAKSIGQFINKNVKGQFEEIEVVNG